MNCLDYRRRVESGTDGRDADVREHAAQCRSCAGFEQRASRFDARLCEAVKIPLPENLEASILLRQSFLEPHAARRWRSTRAALAAGLLLVVAVGLYGARVVYQEAGLHVELLALAEAADYARRSTGPVPESVVDEALRPVGIKVRGGPPNVSFTGRCLVRSNLSGHLVLRDEATPVTVFLMPDEQMVRRSRFEGGGWQGVLLPARHGTVGIVTPRGKVPNEALVEWIMRSVRWPA